MDDREETEIRLSDIKYWKHRIHEHTNNISGHESGIKYFDNMIAQVRREAKDEIIAELEALYSDVRHDVLATRILRLTEKLKELL